MGLSKSIRSAPEASDPSVLEGRNQVVILGAAHGDADWYQRTTPVSLSDVGVLPARLQLGVPRSPAKVIVDFDLQPQNEVAGRITWTFVTTRDEGVL